MKCLIVDEDSRSRSNLEAMCKKIDGMQVAAVSNTDEAMRSLNRSCYDLIFLNIEMEGVGRSDLIRFNKTMPPIILTSSQGYEFDAFQLNAIDHLSMPYTLPRITKAISKFNAFASLSSTNTVQTTDDNCLFIRVDGQHVKLNFSEILFIESMRDYVMFRTSKCRYIVHSTLKNIEEQLCKRQNFLKIHRSYIVNTDHVEDHDDRSVQVGAFEVPVSRSNRMTLQQYFNIHG